MCCSIFWFLGAVWPAAGSAMHSALRVALSCRGCAGLRVPAAAPRLRGPSRAASSAPGDASRSRPRAPPSPITARCLRSSSPGKSGACACSPVKRRASLRARLRSQRWRPLSSSPPTGTAASGVAIIRPNVSPASSADAGSLRSSAPSGASALRDRWKNVARAFVARAGVPSRVALVDDVYTTGSTASSAASALRKAGAAHVEVVTFARAVRTIESGHRS